MPVLPFDGDGREPARAKFRFPRHALEGGACFSHAGAILIDLAALCRKLLRQFLGATDRRKLGARAGRRGFAFGEVSHDACRRVIKARTPSRDAVLLALGRRERGARLVEGLACQP